MPYRAFDDQNCSIARTLAIVGERWTLLVLRDVSLGNRRFEEIRRSLGVASNILSDRLATLVEHGVLERDGDPPEYRLTDKGRDLRPVLLALVQWGDKYTAGEAGPPVEHVHTVCGHVAAPRLHCSHCGEPIGPRELRMQPGPGANEQQREQYERRLAARR
ncbi:helix-turn-helix domain-containing protein [Conexibacter sp. CPCC 206217]|uniref:winged helix-turn-helix transcriptional regulator n=1 Tax=Conexibacter sp. CPCC 206217 TaxID=3064574 RepID=UPI0027182A0D|nr:helix-turn-helix domain-containing protein [Conexibacter sp. CPCC 206217]MDO8213701.1 helix-turn-helix domain-containing protein [Conexibacter sp. CPCC 206217]